MTEKKQRRRLSKWRKEMLINSGIPDSGTQSAVTQGNNFDEVAGEIAKENKVANSYDGGFTFEDKAIWSPSRQG